MMKHLKRIKPLVCGTLCLAMCAMTQTAAAHDTRIQAELANQAFYLGNSEFNPNNNVLDPFTIQTRLRAEIETRVHPCASGVAQFEIGYIPWGNETENSVGQGIGGGLGTDGVNVEVRRLYAKAQLPETRIFFDIGLQGQLHMPTATVNAPIFYDDVAALVGRYDAGKEGGVRMLWARPTRDYFEGESGNIEIGAIDGRLPLGDVTVSPYTMYASIGKGTTLYGRNFGDKDKPLQTNADGYWVGLPVSYTPDKNLYLGADFVYGTVRSETRDEEAAGYLTTFKFKHKNAKNFTTALYGWYGSGNDDNPGNGIEVLPVISGPQSRGLKATSLATDGDPYNISLVTKTGQGTAGVNFALEDINIYNTMKHIISVGYITGTSKAGYGMPLYFGWDFAGQNIGFDEDDFALEYNIDTDWWITDSVRTTFALGAVDMHLKGEKKQNIATQVALALHYYFM